MRPTDSPLRLVGWRPHRHTPCRPRRLPHRILPAAVAAALVQVLELVPARLPPMASTTTPSPRCVMVRRYRSRVAASSPRATCLLTRSLARSCVTVADPEENPHRYVLSTTLPGSRTLHIPTGMVKFKPASGVMPSLPAAAPASPATSTAAPTGTAGGASARAGTAGSGGGSGSATSRPGSSPPPPPAASLGPWVWTVDWRAVNVFLSKASVAALQLHVQAGGLLDFTLRRVVRTPRASHSPSHFPAHRCLTTRILPQSMQATEAMEEDDPADTVYGLEGGRRLVDEDHAYRGKVGRHGSHAASPADCV